jgi:hypothetical protein
MFYFPNVPSNTTINSNGPERKPDVSSFKSLEKAINRGLPPRRNIKNFNHYTE